MACRAARLARRDEDQIIVVQFAPAAHVGVSQLEEINRPVVFAMPTKRQNSLLPRVDLHERFWMIDARSKKALYVNQAYETITGRSCQSVLENPSSCVELIHSDDRAYVLAKLEDAVRNGRFDERFRIMRPEGRLRWVWVRGFPVRDGNGDILRLVGTALEITAQKLAEEQVAANLAMAKSAWAEEEALRKATLALTQDLHMDKVMDALLRSLAEVVPYTCARVLVPEGGPHWLALGERELPEAATPAPRVPWTFVDDKCALVRRIAKEKRSDFRHKKRNRLANLQRT